jgi:hypothetical protein
MDQAIFPEKTPGFVLDVLARRALWSDGLDYRHGKAWEFCFIVLTSGNAPCYELNSGKAWESASLLTRLVTSTTGTIRHIFSNIFRHRRRLCDPRAEWLTQP